MRWYMSQKKVRAAFGVVCSANMWEIHSAHQALTFLYSIGFGSIICLYYDVFRSLRRAVSFSNFAIALQDLFFWILSAFTTFIFLLVRCNGEIRFFVIMGEALGFFLARATISKIFFLLSFKVIVFFNRIFVKIYASYISSLVWIMHIFKDISTFCALFFKNGVKVVKKLLKKVE